MEESWKGVTARDHQRQGPGQPLEGAWSRFGGEVCTETLLPKSPSPRDVQMVINLDVRCCF